jgi:hypothetical protein
MTATPLAKRIEENMVQLARELFGCAEPEHFPVRVKRRDGGFP